MARPKAGDDTGKQRLLEAAISRLAAAPESSVRSQQVADLAETAVTLITHHFGSREQLIEDAQQARLANLIRRDLTQLKRTFRDATTPDMFRDAIHVHVSNRLNVKPTEKRQLLSLFGATHGRHGLSNTVATLYGEVVTAWMMILLDAQQARIVSPTVDVRSAATTITALTYGTSFTGLDNDAPTVARLADTYTAMLVAMLGLTHA